MNRYTRYFFIIILSSLMLMSCERALDKYYDKPSLIGTNIYDALDSLGNYSLFLEGVRLVDQENSLRYTLMTVLAPPDEVFKKYLDEKGFKSLTGIPPDTLSELINFHLIEWPFASNQFAEEPHNYRRKTRAKKLNEKEYGFLMDNEYKFASFFYKEMFEYYNGITDDYKLLTGEDFVDFHVYNATVIEKDKSYANGWVHVLDRVIEPYQNLDDWLYNTSEYSAFKDLFHRFNKYRRTNYDDEYKTFRYVKENFVFGINHDNLIDFFIDFEGVECHSGQQERNTTSIGREGYTILAPSNQALNQFLDTYFVDFPEFDSLVKLSPNQDKTGYIDNVTRQIIRPSLFDKQLILPGAFEQGLVITTDGRQAQLDVNSSETDITLCSNGVGYGTNSFEPPRAFQSVLRPVFTNPEHSMFAAMISGTPAESILADKKLIFTLFIPTNTALQNFGISYTYNTASKSGTFNISINGNNEELSNNDILYFVYTHIAPSVKVKDNGQNNFTRSFTGQYLGFKGNEVWSGDNKNIWKDTIIGGVPSYVELPPEIPAITRKYDETYVDNGVTYSIDKVILAPTRDMGDILALRPEYSRFKELCEDAGILRNGQLDFVIPPNNFTGFIPTNTAIEDYANQGLIPSNTEELIKFVTYHFVHGDIFSDGLINGEQVSALINEELSNEAISIYLTIEINNINGDLSIKGLQNTNYITLIEGENSNVICSDGVLHSINGILEY